MNFSVRKSVFVVLIGVSAGVSGCGAVGEQSFLLGVRGKSGVEDKAARHHQEQEQERGGADDGIQHKERRHGSQSNDDAVIRQRIKNPGDQSSIKGAGVSLSLEKVRPGDDDAYSFEASGLPAGLVIAASSGQISGVISAEPGVYPVTVMAKELEESEDHPAAEIKFNWVVLAQ